MTEPKREYKTAWSCLNNHAFFRRPHTSVCRQCGEDFAVCVYSYELSPARFPFGESQVDGTERFERWRT